MWAAQRLAQRLQIVFIENVLPATLHSTLHARQLYLFIHLNIFYAHKSTLNLSSNEWGQLVKFLLTKIFDVTFLYTD